MTVKSCSLQESLPGPSTISHSYRSAFSASSLLPVPRVEFLRQLLLIGEEHPRTVTGGGSGTAPRLLWFGDTPAPVELHRFPRDGVTHVEVAPVQAVFRARPYHARTVSWRSRATAPAHSQVPAGSPLSVRQFAHEPQPTPDHSYNPGPEGFAHRSVRSASQLDDHDMTEVGRRTPETSLITEHRPATTSASVSNGR